MAANSGNTPSFSMRMTIYGIKKKFPSVRNVTCEQLEQWRGDSQRNILCLDTRNEEEYNVSHLSGAIHVDPNEQRSIESLQIPVGATVVCYCSVGYRSSDVAQKLYRQAKAHSRAEGLQLYNLEGGIFQWVCEGRGLVDNAGERATTVHPYSSFWGNLLPSHLKSSL